MEDENSREENRKEFSLKMRMAEKQREQWSKRRGRTGRKPINNDDQLEKLKICQTCFLCFWRAQAVYLIKFDKVGPERANRGLSFATFQWKFSPYKECAPQLSPESCWQNYLAILCVCVDRALRRHWSNVGKHYWRLMSLGPILGPSTIGILIEDSSTIVVSFKRLELQPTLARVENIENYCVIINHWLIFNF